MLTNNVQDVCVFFFLPKSKVYSEFMRSEDNSFIFTQEIDMTI